LEYEAEQEETEFDTAGYRRLARLNPDFAQKWLRTATHPGKFERIYLQFSE
jgi:hypothetical protein